MKKTIMIIALMLATTLAFTQQNVRGIVKLRGTRLTHPLVRKWIDEFGKEYPNIIVKIAQEAPSDSIDFNIASYKLSGSDIKENQRSVVVTRYVQLPVVNSQRPDLNALQTHGIKENDLRALFFKSTDPALPAVGGKLQLYVRDRPVCAVKAFAAHFGDDPKKINGIVIKGDDQDLATAVKNDVNGISFNNLGFIYDVRSGKVQAGLAIVPLDLNENGKIDGDERIYDTLDEVIQYVEKTKSPRFVNEHVNFIFNEASTNIAAATFLKWVLSKGQQYNHQLGFINLENDFLVEQQEILRSGFKVGSATSCEGADKVMSQRKSKN
jgi:phosphate transport system substrate-binding protein